MNILVQGAEPFRLVRRIEDLPYPAGDVELLDDEEDGDAGGGPTRRARATPTSSSASPTRARAKSDLADLDAYGMAATLDFALDAKQDLLELRSERLRMERLGELFARRSSGSSCEEKAAERRAATGT